MTIQFVLIRHGIAENCSEDRRDFSRRLTEKGRQRLAATLPSLLPLLRPMLEEQQERQIWTSPLIRAIETAEIAADIFNHIVYYGPVLGIIPVPALACDPDGAFQNLQKNRLG